MTGATVRALVVGDEAAPLAIAVHAVRSVVADPPLTPVPTAPPTVLGLANVRGEIVPVLDTGLLLGLDAVGRAAYVLVVDTARGPAGFAVPAMPVPGDVADDHLTDPNALVSP